METSVSRIPFYFCGDTVIHFSVRLYQHGCDCLSDGVDIWLPIISIHPDLYAILMRTRIFFYILYRGGRMIKTI